MNSDDKAAVFITLAIATVAILITVALLAIVAMDSFTNDERNQIPRCDTVTEVLVGLGDFYNGRWDDYTCIDRESL